MYKYVPGQGAVPATNVGVRSARLTALFVALLETVLLAIALAACSVPNEPPPLRMERAVSALDPLPSTAWVGGDATLGRLVIGQFECARCHTGLPQPPPSERCSGCHRNIVDGTANYPIAPMIRWRSEIRHLIDVPALTTTGERLQRSFVARFLSSPFPIRPALEETMPHLPLTEDDIRNVAALLGSPEPSVTIIAGNAAAGQRLFEARGCPTCHARGEEAPSALLLAPAPDLGFAALRLSPVAIQMRIERHELLERALDSEEAEDLVAYIVALRPVRRTVPPPPPRLPRLDRHVAFDEVLTRVLRTSCWHCHSEPDYALG